MLPILFLFVRVIIHDDGCLWWSRNRLPLRSIWVHPAFKLSFVLRKLFHLVFCVPLFVLKFCFPLIIALYVFRRFTASDYHCDIFRLILHINNYLYYLWNCTCWCHIPYQSVHIKPFPILHKQCNSLCTLTRHTMTTWA